MLKTQKGDKMEILKDHFNEILNRGASNDPITEDDIEHIEELEDIDYGK